MKRRTAALLSAVMAFAILFSFAGVASADKNLPVDVNLVVGNSDSDTSGYTQVTTPQVSNSSIATAETVQNGSTYYVKITAKAAGQTTVTYSGYLSNEWVHVTATVRVTQSATTGTLAAQTIAVGGTYSTQSYTGVTNLQSSNSAVATATVDATGIVKVTGVAGGAANITFTHSGGSITLPITVSSDTTSTVDLAIGGLYSMVYQDITSATSADSNIAKVETTTMNDGKKQAVISGTGNGTTTVTVIYKEAANSASATRTVTVRVGAAMGGAAATTTTTNASTDISVVEQPKVATSRIPANTSTEGIFIPKRTVNAKQDKTYRVPNIKLEGKTVKAANLRWVAEDSSVLQVNTKTGTFKCLKAGTSKLFVTDMNGQYMNYVTVTVG